MGFYTDSSSMESRILAASPTELVQILYEAAIDSVGEARRHLASGDIAARSKSILRACDILLELTGSVNREANPELGQNLVELYDYMARRLIEANREQADPPLAEVANLLVTLLEGWRQCHEAPVETLEEPELVAMAAGAYDEPVEASTQSWMA